MELLEHVFSHVCGSANIGVLGGDTLPSCPRLTGLYLRGLAGLTAYLWWRAFSLSGTSPEPTCCGARWQPVLLTREARRLSRSSIFSSGKMRR